MADIDAKQLLQIQAGLEGTFLEESFEGLERVEAGLLGLDDSSDPEAVADVFRAMHSIKGGAGAFGIAEIGRVAHAMESVLDALRAGAALGAGGAEALLHGVDAVRAALGDRQAGRAIDTTHHDALIAAIDSCLAGAAPAPTAPTPFASAPTAPAVAEGTTWQIDFAPAVHMMRSGNDPLRILREVDELGAMTVAADLSQLPMLEELDPSACHLRWRLSLAGAVERSAIESAFAWVDGDCDLEIARLGAAPPVAAGPVRGAVEAPAAPAAGERTESAVASSIRVGVDKIDALMNMVGELVITQSMLGELDGDGPIDAGRLAQIREGLGQLARNTRSLQDSVMRLRSVPISSVFNRFPRLVHDLGHRLGKQVELAISGQATELDKSIIEKLGDPLVHLVRNSVDHGIETPAVRRAAGKPEQGTIRLHAEHRGGDVLVEIHDDGGGLDLERILARARERGLVGADAVLDDAAIAQLIFMPGFSTAEAVSDVSGRGVGMDVVRRNVIELGGDIAIETRRGQGSRIQLRLPLTLAIIDGQLIRLGVHTYVVPLLSIVESVEVEPQRRNRLAGRCDLYHLRDHLVPVLDLARQLEVEAACDGARQLMVIVEADGQPLGLLVDELLGQQQVVVKSLEANYGRVGSLAGATILGDGRVAFILDVVALAHELRRGGRRDDTRALQRVAAA
jgi:two-component system chemotaxis sensor kinase CheA